MSYDPNEMMLELFRAEVESHSDSLTSSLLKLEQDPTDTGLLDGMMRAAHSIKGAARIVRVEAAVEVAHVMEDCFVAAQRGELVLEPAGIDILLRAVDLLGHVSAATKNPNVDWNTFQSAIESTVSLLRNVLHGQSIGVVESPSPLPPSQAPIPTASHSAPIEQQSPSILPIASPDIIQPSSVPIDNRICIPEILNRNNAESTRVQLLAALEGTAHHGEVIVDLSLTRELDAIGLSLLHSANQFAAIKNRSLRFENASTALARVLQAVGIEAIVGALAIEGQET